MPKRRPSEAMRGSYEIVNQTASRVQGWDAHYREFLKFYDANKDSGWFTAIRQRWSMFGSVAVALKNGKKVRCRRRKDSGARKEASYYSRKKCARLWTLAIVLGLGGMMLLRSGK